uniref:Uncharacterized protein n=1 Tax=Sinocyclocheilus grahami TaxID=75366 RepID=A0A672TDA7_SINGR
MFENWNAAEQPKLSFRQAGSSTSTDTSAGSKTGGSQHLKNALNLGKAMGAKVNDLLRRKDPSSLGDIGVTEVNKNAIIAQICGIIEGIVHISLDSFPRLDPPPPTGKKRLPRALKTTQDMMISSDPVVASPESSFVSSPDKISKDKDVDQSQLLLSVPDLIHKDNLDPKKLASSETRMASTPCPGKGGCRISVTEGELLGNGTADYRTLSLENEESHPDLLSFE